MQVSISTCQTRVSVLQCTIRYPSLYTRGPAFSSNFMVFIRDHGTHYVSLCSECECMLCIYATAGHIPAPTARTILLIKQKSSMTSRVLLALMVPQKVSLTPDRRSPNSKNLK